MQGIVLGFQYYLGRPFCFDQFAFRIFHRSIVFSLDGVGDSICFLRPEWASHNHEDNFEHSQLRNCHDFVVASDAYTTFDNGVRGK